MNYLYPRLPDIDGLKILGEMKKVELPEVRAMVGYFHDHAAPAPTGGSPITEDGIRLLREAVLGAVSGWIEGDRLPRNSVARFDLELGRALYGSMKIVPGDAANTGVWTFLSTVVFPDLVKLRFPDLHENRVLGHRRNTLRRLWERESVLGDLQAAASDPLGEDELVGLFERSALARNRPLVRALAEGVLSYDGTDRSEFARRLYAEARYSTGPLLLDALDLNEIKAHVQNLQVSSTMV